MRRGWRKGSNMVAATADFNHYQVPCMVLELHRGGGLKPLKVVMTDDGKMWAEMWGWILDKARYDRQVIAYVEGVYLIPVDYIIDPAGLGDDELRVGFTGLLPHLRKMFSGKSSGPFKVKIVDG